MILGPCPYCDEFVSTPVGPPGAWSKETCSHCHKQYFLKHSRIDPIAYPLENVTVDEATKTIQAFK